MAHLRLLNLKSTILGDTPDEDGDDAEDDAKRKEEACAELTQLLDDQSLSLVMREMMMAEGRYRFLRW